jgi:Secretion system C-terminal sorting domain
MQKFYFFIIIIILGLFDAKAQLDCSGAIIVNPGTQYSGTTVGGQKKVSTYNNDPWWQLTGPEKVHILNWTGGNIEINLTNKGAALDLILLNACDANNFNHSGGGNSGKVNSTIKKNLSAGTYYIVVDGWQMSEGTYTLSISSPIKELQITILKASGLEYRTFRHENSNVYEIINGSPKLITTNVSNMDIGYGAIINSASGEIIDAQVLYIVRDGETKPRIFYNENFNTEYLKQILDCPQKKLSLFGEFVFDGNQQILSNCDVLRCENGYTLAHQKDGQIKLFQNNAWLDIKQIITVDGLSYYVRKSDNSIWILSTNTSEIKQIGINTKLLQDNDNQLIRIDLQGNYTRWDGTQWASLVPKYIGVSPEMIDEGFWFFMQAKNLLDKAGNVNTDHKTGLTFDTNGQLKMELIPATGDCDRFLWRTKSLANGKRILINKAKGENTPLLMGTNGIPNFTNGSNEWAINVSNKSKYGTNAYHLVDGGSTKALAYENSVTSSSPQAGNKSQTWVLQFNQMVKDYFLPMPTKEILKTHFVNPTINLDKDADLIAQDYNKFLKGDNGTHFFSTNTGSDWAIVNYYFIIDNMLNATISPKPSDPKIDPNLIKPLSVLSGVSINLINKNDLNYNVSNLYFVNRSLTPLFVSTVRGISAYRNPRKYMLFSEEFACKTGNVNRPIDKIFRRFDHGIHEYAHGMQDKTMTGWTNIIDAYNMCDSWGERGDESSECFCYATQDWFNSTFSSNTYPGIRASSQFNAQLMEKFFNKDNTWQPPKDLRKDGYNPSGQCQLSAKIVAANGVSFCAGESVNITAEATSNSTSLTYNWKQSTTDVGNSKTLAVNKAGNYILELTDNKGCVASASVEILQKPTPNVVISKNGSTDLLTGGTVSLSIPTAPNQTYQWLKDGVAISGATNNSYIASEVGKFTVKVTANGCSATSESVEVRIVLANELPTVSKNFKVSPNPFENSLKINFNEPLIKSAQLNLITSTGTILKEWTTNQQESSFDVSGLSSGIYILRCEINNKIEAIKLIKN